MLLRFGVENHASIASYQELLLTATTLRDADDGLLVAGPAGDAVEGVSAKKLLKVVPVAAIYGANAAGKSTLLDAFDFFVSAIISSHARIAASEGTPYVPFLLDDVSREKPSRYDADIVLGNTRYHYGFSLDGKIIVNEWLYSYSLDAVRQTKSTLFLRETNAKNPAVDVDFGKGLRGENKQIAKLVRPNSLFLSVAAQNAHPQLTPLFEFFNTKVARRLDRNISLESIAKQLLGYFGGDGVRQKLALNILKAADIGISGMDFSKTPISEKTKIMLQEFEQIINRHIGGDESDKVSFIEKEDVKASLHHIGRNSKSYPIGLQRESAGTLSLLQLIGPALVRLSEGGVLVIDELNSTLHPLVSRELIRLFSNHETNIGKAQLLFTTHDTNLLSGNLLRRDQIWFAEKDDGGATHVYSLSDINVRADDNFERGYLTGRFGAIPFIGESLKDLFRFSNIEHQVGV